MAGGFLAVALAGLIPAPGFVLLPLVMALMALLGLAVSATAYLPLRNRPPVSVFISTIAVGIILQNGATVLFGPEPKAAPPLFGGGAFTLAGLQIPEQSLAVIGTAALLIAGQYWLFTHTQLGRRLRATAQDPDMARACGIPVTSMIALTFALGAALAGAAGLLLSNQFFVTPTSGSGLILKAYIAVTIGGWGSIAGAVAGALLIAAFEVVVSYTLSYTAATAALYLALLAILAVRPQGLFGEAARRRA
jgi:branched-chain amino acid transport system permease protein